MSKENYNSVYARISILSIVLFYMVCFANGDTTNNITLYCELEISNCTLDDKTCAQRPYSRIHDTADFNTLRITCKDYNKQTLDWEVLAPFVTLKELYTKNVIVPTIPTSIRLTRLEIWKGTFREKSQPIGECRDLETLEVLMSRIDGLPEAWLAGCTKLRTVLIEYVEGLQYLPSRMLEGATELRHLSIRDCNIVQLPSDLISYSPHLRTLDISLNLFTELPKRFFRNTPSLERLKLIAKNTNFDAQDELYNLSNITFLMLDYAHKYGKCFDEVLDSGNYRTFPFNSMPRLEYLSLEWTGATKICPEWGELFPSLKKIDLRDNFIGSLKYSDVEVIRKYGWTIDFSATSTKSKMLEAIEFTESDYKAAVLDQDIKNATIQLNQYGGRCDCRWYWFIRTMKARPDYVSLDDFKCWWTDPPGSYNVQGASIVDAPVPDCAK